MQVSHQAVVGKLGVEGGGRRGIRFSSGSGGISEVWKVVGGDFVSHRFLVWERGVEGAKRRIRFLPGGGEVSEVWKVGGKVFVSI